jgi:hypothetical protein
MKTGPWYIALYQTNDNKSRKDCTTTLVLGLPSLGGGNPTEQWGAWIILPCPACNFSHAFKRQEYSERVALETMGDYEWKWG